MYLEIIYGIVISLLHFFSDYIGLKLLKYKEKLLSFGAGISITYLFLDLLPLIHETVQNLREISYISILVGFASFHLVEKYVYQHTKKSQLIDKLKKIHSIGFFVYYFIVGIILYYLTNQDILAGSLFLIPVLFHSSISSASAREIHKEIKKNKYWRIFLSSSTIFGVLVSYFLNIPLTIVFVLLGFVVGALFYIIIKDILPEQKEGDPKYFIIGAILFVIIIIILRRILI